MSHWTAYGNRYSCSIRGNCEPTWKGDYPSLSACQEGCQGNENADLIYLTLSYDWDLTAQATIGDQREVLRREFGLNLTNLQTIKAIRLLRAGEIGELVAELPAFEEVYAAELSPFTLFAIKIYRILRPNARQAFPEFEAMLTEVVVTEKSWYADGYFEPGNPVETMASAIATRWPSLGVFDGQDFVSALPGVMRVVEENLEVVWMVG